MLRGDEPIALPLHLAIDYDDLAGIDMDQGAGDMGSFIVPFKCEVFLAGLMTTEVHAGTTPGVLDFDKRPTAGSDASRGAADVAHFMLGTTATGKVLYDEVGKGVTLEPGQEVVVQLTTQPVTGPSGHVMPFLLVKYIPETPANMSGMVETA